MRGVFITGCGTDVGKTIVSAIVLRALDGFYWKPVQAGTKGGTDRETVARLAGVDDERMLPERYLLSQPMSPHAAAAIDRVRIDPRALSLPERTRPIVVEGAGGVMVPLNEEYFVADLIVQLKLPVIFVSRNYLGSINHTLLSIDALVSRGVQVLGLVFNGPGASPSEEVILSYTGLPRLLSVSEEPEWSADLVASYAGALRAALKRWL